MAHTAAVTLTQSQLAAERHSAFTATDATRVIVDGSTIVVDGSAGIVEL